MSIRSPQYFSIQPSLLAVPQKTASQAISAAQTPPPQQAEPIDAGVAVTLGITVPDVKNVARGSWMPYLDREHWSLSFRNWARALGLEGIQSFFLSIIVATIVSLEIGPESFGVRATIVGFVQGLAIFLFYSQRHTTPNLPRSLDPGLTFARWIKRDSHLGIVTALAMIGVQYGFSALSSVFLAATGGSAVPNYTASLRPTSLAGAVGIEILLTSLRYWIILHNETSGNNRKDGIIDVNALLAGLGYFVCTIVSYANGLYLSGNAVMYFGSAINLGFDIPAGSNYWVFAIFVVPPVSAIVAALFDLFFHNVTNASTEYLAQMEASERAALETDKAVIQKSQYTSINSRYTV